MLKKIIFIYFNYPYKSNFKIFETIYPREVAKMYLQVFKIYYLPHLLYCRYFYLFNIVFLPTRKNMTLLIRGEKLISFKHPIELLSELFLSIIFVYLCNSSYNLLKLAHFIPFFFHLFDRNLLKK